jgi:transposase
MPTSKQETQRQCILHLWKKGVRNGQEIHRRTDIPLSTIYDNIKKIKKKGTVDHARGNGRPKKIAGSTSKAIGQFIRRDTSISTRTLAAKVSNFGVEVSYVTISRHLAALGYSKALPKATPMLTTIQKQNRVEWARRHLNDDWSTTLFSDETAFQLFRNTVERWYKGARPVRPTPKNRTKIFAWGGFSAKGKTSLFCFQRIMNAQFYVEILQRHLPEANRMLGSNWRFQQDNDPKHTSRLAQEFLRENVPSTMDWPSNSPDLNPIENLWNIVKRVVEKRLPKNLGELEIFMGEAWGEISEETLINLVESMPRRCELVIESNGERISY